MGKGRNVSLVTLLKFDQPGIKGKRIQSLFYLFFFFLNGRKDYRIKQLIVITAKKKKPKTTVYSGRAMIL